MKETTMDMFPAYIMGSYVAGIKHNILTYQRINYNEWNIISHRKKWGERIRKRDRAVF